MRTSKILMLLSAIIFLASCSNDETEYNVLNQNEIKVEGKDFVDPRDGNVYKCIQVGNQIWMAENLAYYIPTGQLAGCYNWTETELDADKLLQEAADMAELRKKAEEESGFSGGEISYNTYVDLFWTYYDYGWGLIPPGDEDDYLWEYGYFDLYDNIYSDYKEALAALKKVAPKWYAQFNPVVEALTSDPENHIPNRTKGHSDQFADTFTKEYGYLYTLDGAKAAVPEGWRIPSDEDWKKLETALGMSSDLDVMNAWRGENAGNYLKVGGEAGFNAIYAGCNAWTEKKETAGYWVNRDYSTYFWCSDETSTTVTEETEDEEGNTTEETTVIREGIVRQVSIYSPKIWRGVTRLDGVCYSVRCVIDANEFEALYANNNTEEEAGN